MDHLGEAKMCWPYSESIQFPPKITGKPDAISKPLLKR